MSEWQPIESVPRDGTHVLLYCAAVPVTSGYWDYGGWRLSVPGEYAQSDPWDESQLHLRPTHWMPLPAAPTG